VNYAFYFALFIGIFALVNQAIPNKMMNIIFTIILCIYYFLFALKYLNYSTIIKILPENNIADNEEHEQRTNYSTKIEWSFLKNEILEKKYYLKIGITLEDLASTLKVGRTTLSNLINKEEGVNFNTWINKLRIEVAKKILIEKNTYTLQEVSEMVGYSEQSNFSKQFKIFTKKTPSEWKKKNFT
jgi:two-component system response regulator YesN